MGAIIMTAQLLASLSILVFIHELGHFLAAKAFGMRVNKFYIFFDAWGKKIWSKKWGDTEYGIGWLPLGGYVQIAGMIDETQDAQSLSDEPEEWEFRAKPAWQRFIVMIGGVTMNVILGVLIFMMYLTVFQKEYLPTESVNSAGGIEAFQAGKAAGLQTGDKIVAIDGEMPTRFKDMKLATFLGKEITVERNGQEIKWMIPDTFQAHFRNEFIAPIHQHMKVMEVMPASNAEKAGLQKEDVITGINDLKVVRFRDFVKHIQNFKGQGIQLKVEREGQPMTLQAQVDTSGKLGFAPADLVVKEKYNFKPYSWGNSFGFSLEDGYNLILTQIMGIKMMFTGKLAPSESIASPIAIATMFGATWEWGHFWWLTGLLSFILAFMNILPIPALDGGHVVFLLYEMITGRKLSDQFLEKAQMVGIVLLMCLMVYAFGNDIYKLIF